MDTKVWRESSLGMNLLTTVYSEPIPLKAYLFSLNRNHASRKMSFCGRALNLVSAFCISRALLQTATITAFLEGLVVVRWQDERREPKACVFDSFASLLVAIAVLHFEKRERLYLE